MIRYCRTCLEPITGMGYFGVDETIPSCSIPIRGQLLACIPGINMNIMKNAFICNTCSTSLAHSHQFYEKCMRSEAKIREIIQQVELRNENKNQVLTFEQHNVKTEQLEVDVYTEVALGLEPPGTGYGHQKNFYVKETENCNYLNNSTVILNDYFMETGDFHTKEMKNCDGSFADFQDVESSNQNLVEVKDFYAEKTESPSSELMDVNTQTTKQLQVECFAPENDTFQTASKLQNCHVKLTRLSDSITSTEATVLTISGKFALKCVTCSGIFKTNEVFENHPCRKNPRHTSDQNILLYNCITCEAAFPNITKYNHHMNQSHNGELAVKCGLCGHILKYACNLKRHIKMHTGVKPFKCDLCGNRYTTQNCLEYHMRSHSGEKPLQLNKFTLQCIKCNRAFKTNKTFKQHLCTDNSSYSTVKNPRLPYKCTVCEAIFPRYPSYKRHMCDSHSDEVSVKCSICDLVLRHGFYLKGHMQIHTGKTPFNCNLCHNRFQNRQKLDFHIQATHSNQCEFNCVHCNSVFDTNKLFMEHLCEGSFIGKYEI